MPLEVLVGLVGIGGYLVLTSLPAFRSRAPLADRLARFDVDARLRSRAVPGEPDRPVLPWPALDAAFRPVLEDLVAPLHRLLWRDGLFGTTTARLLRVVEPTTSRAAFTVRQLAWGLGSGALFLAVFASRQQLGPTIFLLTALAAVVGFLGPWLRLRQQARRHQQRLLAELPHVARLVALGLSASLPLDVALSHVGAYSHGHLGQLLARAGQLAADGTASLLAELHRAAAREDLAELDSFVQLLVAGDRQGVYLVASLESFATTLQQRRAARLLALAERGTIKMLLPLALILTPVIVVVALVPGLLALYALVHGG